LEKRVPKRIAFLGTSGAGKTTIGRELAKRLDCVFVEVDALQHRANWARASSGELGAVVRSALADHERWVIDGTCEREVGDFVSSRADVIVWLDLPLVLKLVRLFRRSWRRVRTREVLWNGNIETWRGVFVGRDAVLIHPVRKHFPQRREILRRSDAHKIVRLRTPREVERWLATTTGSPSLGRQ
jgi:adenylate kinase family enzyme